MKNLILLVLFLCSFASIYLFYCAVVEDNNYNPSSSHIEAILAALITVMSITAIGLVARNFKITMRK